MATWMAHLRIAEELLGNFNYLEETEFIMGNLAPDSGVPNAYWSVFTPNKNLAHFYSIGENGKKYIDVQKYVNQYFTREMCKMYGKKEFSFYFGYYVHLLSDVLWRKEIVEEAILADKEEAFDDRREYPYLSPEKMETFIEHAVDFVMNSYFTLMENMQKEWMNEQKEWNDSCRWIMTKYNRALNREAENEIIYQELLQSALENESEIKIVSSHYGLIRHYILMEKYEKAYLYFESLKEKANLEFIKENYFYLFQHILREYLRLLPKYSKKAEAMWDYAKPLLRDELERLRLDLYPCAIIAAEFVNDPYAKELELKYTDWKNI